MNDSKAKQLLNEAEKFLRQAQEKAEEAIIALEYPAPLDDYNDRYTFLWDIETGIHSLPTIRKALDYAPCDNCGFYAPELINGYCADCSKQIDSERE